MSHVDDGRLNAWLDRDRSGMAEAEHAEIAAHLEGCGACTARLESARRDCARSVEILAGAGPMRMAAPDFESLSARAGMRASSRNSNRRLIALAWAASLVASIGIGWVTRDLFRPEQVALDVESPTRRPLAVASSPPAVPPIADAEAPAAPASPSDASTASVRSTSTWTGPSATAAQRTESDATARGAPGAAASGAVLGGPARSAPATGARVTDGPSVEFGRPATDAPATAASGREFGTPAGSVPAEETPEDIPSPDSDPQARLAEADVTPGPQPEPRSVPASVELEQIAVVGTAAGRSAAGLADAVSAPPPAAPAPPLPPTQGPVASFAPIAPAFDWVTVSRDEAERRLGAAIVTHADLPLLRIDVAMVGGGTVVRVFHVLPDGGMLMLTQRLESSAAMLLQPNANGAVTIRRGAVIVEASAPLTVDSIAALLERMR